MTSRVSFAPQNLQKMYEQVEREHESKKLIVLLERVKKQIAAREDPAYKVESPKPPAVVLNVQSSSMRPPSLPFLSKA